MNLLVISRAHKIKLSLSRVQDIRLDHLQTYIDKSDLKTFQQLKLKKANLSETNFSANNEASSAKTNRSVN